jgi:hypothetical protein
MPAYASYIDISGIAGAITEAFREAINVASAVMIIEVRVKLGANNITLISIITPAVIKATVKG